MKLKILHLEDCAIDSELIAAELAEGGINADMRRVETRTAFSDELNNQNFDLILADYNLPSFDGLSALEIARQISPNTPFIILSGAVGEEVAIDTLKSGATDYILKHRLERLVPSVRRALRETDERRRTKVAERKTLEAERRFEMLSRVANDVIWEMDFRTRTVWTSESMFEVTGFRPEEVKDFEWWQNFIHEDERDKVLEKMRSALAQNQKDWKDEFRVRCKDGTYIFVMSRAFNLYDENKQPFRTVGAMTDITAGIEAAEERLKLLESERKARQKAEEANRLKDEFLATVSHELRTPLNSILGWATMLRGGTLDTNESRRAIEVIEESARTQSRIIEDILDVSRIITGKLQLNPQPLSLSPIIQNAVYSVRPAAAAKSIDLDAEIDANLGTITADASRLQQIVWNLLSNAVKFTPSGGQVAVAVKENDGAIEIKVRDTGSGIAPEFLPFVFDRFRQAEGSTTRRFGGLGLGLSIVKNLVEMHGGTVAVESAGLEKGTVFTVILPRHTENLSATSPVAEPETAQNGAKHHDTPLSLHGLRILAVDDDAASLEILELMLNHFQAQVVTAQSVTDAMKKLETESFDALVSDVGMPLEDGYSLARRLRRMPASSNGTIAAIALTGFAREDDRRTAVDAGFDAHLSKPYDFDELTRILIDLTKQRAEAAK